ncbi:hypothetical protein LINPERHAP2_LOCUS29075 [Linum perenne]
MILHVVPMGWIPLIVTLVTSSVMSYDYMGISEPRLIN